MEKPGNPCAVYAGNLSWSTTEEQLLSFAGADRGAISAEIKRHKDTKRSKGWGLIHFATVDQAVAAVAALNSVVMNDRAVHVRMDRDSEVDLLGSSCIYVGNIPWQTTEEELEEAFSSFSPHHCKVMKNMSGRSRGFAVLKFRTEEASLLAINAMNNSEIGGRRIECRDDRETALRYNKNCAVFVSHLELSITNQALAEMFGDAGVVLNAKIHLKPDGSPRGWGVVTFQTPEEAERAIHIFNGKVQSSALPLEVRYDRARN